MEAKALAAEDNLINVFNGFKVIDNILSAHNGYDYSYQQMFYLPVKTDIAESYYSVVSFPMCILFVKARLH